MSILIKIPGSGTWLMLEGHSKTDKRRGHVQVVDVGDIDDAHVVTPAKRREE